MQESLKDHCSLPAMGAEKDVIAGQTEHFFPNGFLGKGNHDHGFSNQSADQQNCLGLAVVGEKATIADLHEAMRQHLEQKPTNELRCRQIHGFAEVGITSILVGKNDAMVFDGFNPVVGDGNPLGITGQTFGTVTTGTPRFNLLMLESSIEKAW